VYVIILHYKASLTEWFSGDKKGGLEEAEGCILLFKKVSFVGTRQDLSDRVYWL
jgi:hypothetical protein